MRPCEAEWICAALLAQGPERGSPVANIGSSTLEFRTKKKPHIEERLLQPLREAGFEIINIDLREDPGVDLVGDLTDPQFVEGLRAIGFRSVICSNLLEHLADRQPLTRACSDIVPPDGLVVVTVPYSYPYHPDPIDTLYRPSPEEIAGAFPGLAIIRSAILADGGLASEELSGGIARSARYLFFSLARMLYVVRPRIALAQAHRLTWLFRDFKVSCVVLKKQPEPAAAGPARA